MRPKNDNPVIYKHLKVDTRVLGYLKKLQLERCEAIGFERKITMSEIIAEMLEEKYEDFVPVHKK